MMRRAVVLILASAGLCAAADLAQRLATAVQSAPASVRGVTGIHVVDLASGATTYASNENQLLMPASNLKLFTAALALSRLGPDFRFETSLVREPSGSLVLVGSGDPSMSGRVYPYDAEAKPIPSLHAFDEIAEGAVAAGLKVVEGDIVGSDTRYAWSPYPESWTADDSQHDYGAPVSALALNDNFVTITIRPGARAGDLAHVEIDPPFEYFSVDNRVTTGAGTLRVTRVPGSRQILLDGAIGPRAVRTELVAVDDPALFAAHALYDALLRRGVRVRGRPAARHNVLPRNVLYPGTTVFTRKSPPLAELLRAMLKVSQNLHAEMLLREVGLRTQGQGTVEAGLREMRIFLGELQIPASAWVSEDGSGLARNDEVSPRAVTRLLTAMAAGPHRALWRELLPVGGQDGTLSNRLCCTTDVVSIRAKTGSLSRAVTLSGYADSPANGKLAFSILVNNFSAPSQEVRAWVDRLASTLVE